MSDANTQLDVIKIREPGAASAVQYLWFFFIIEFQFVVGITPFPANIFTFLPAHFQSTSSFWCTGGSTDMKNQDELQRKC